MPTGSDILLNEARCLGCGGLSQGQMIVVALLNRIAEAGGGAGSCENLEGIESPLNVVTPDFIGQVFVQSDGTIWQAGSLLSSSWTVICDGANDEGLVWGPAPETVDSLSGSLDQILLAINGVWFGTSAFTDLSFGNPEVITTGVDFSGSNTMTSLAMRNLVSVGFSLDCNTCASMTSVSAPLLQSIGAGLIFNDCGSLTTINFNSLQTVALAISFANCTVLTSVMLPALQSCDSIDVSAAVEILSLTALTVYPPSQIIAGGSLLTLNLPACVDDAAGTLQFDFGVMSGLVTLNLNSLVTPSVDFDLTASPNLASVNLSAMIAPDGTNFNFLGCSLTQASVDHILARLVANPAYISGTVDLSGGTSAAPGVQGAADVIVLTGRGVIVTTN